jgi:hypothetical protein
MLPIKFIEKESNYLYVTFAKDEIRFKAPKEKLESLKEDFKKYIRRIESMVYKNFEYTLRGHINLKIYNQYKLNYIPLYAGIKKSRRIVITIPFGENK